MALKRGSLFRGGTSFLISSQSYNLANRSNGSISPASAAFRDVRYAALASPARSNEAAPQLNTGCLYSLLTMISAYCACLATSCFRMAGFSGIFFDLFVARAFIRLKASGVMPR